MRNTIARTSKQQTARVHREKTRTGFERDDRNQAIRFENLKLIPPFAFEVSRKCQAEDLLMVVYILVFHRVKFNPLKLSFPINLFNIFFNSYFFHTPKATVEFGPRNVFPVLINANLQQEMYLITQRKRDY